MCQVINQVFELLVFKLQELNFFQQQRMRSAFL